MTGILARATGLLLGALLLAGACAAPGSSPAPERSSAGSSPVAAATAPSAPAGGPTAAPPPLSPPVVVRVASLLGLTDAGLFIAQDRGYFAEEGLEIEHSRVDGAAQAMPHVATGQLDVAGVTPSAALFNAVNRGLPLRIAGDKGHVAPGYSQNTWMLREDLAASGAVRDWADLRGHTLGINVPNSGSSTDIMLDGALERGGLTRDEVRVVELPYPDINAAFANQTIEAALHTEPFATLGVNLGVARRWRPASDVRSEQYTGVWIYSPQFAATEAAYRFMVAYLRGVRDYNDAVVHGRGKDAIVDILARYTAVKDPALYAQMQFAAIDPDGRVRPEVLERDVQYYLAKGFMQQPVDVRQVIDQRFADYALSRLGPYRPPAP
ncbi:MAG TPA: ABC transporter substrate-binding protein [Chloroflexota bacterium]|nr:ABC transporter substrate-binding protein [Chloroflexota bacterium]